MNGSIQRHLPVSRIGVLLFLLMAMFSGIPLSYAVTFTVTKTADTNDGVCNSDCSVREAIRAANASAGADTVSIPAGTYPITIPGRGEDIGNTGDLDINDHLTIIGAGSTQTIIDANQLDRVLDSINTVGIDPVVFLEGLTLRNGDIPACGGGMSSEGRVDMTDVALLSNHAFTGGALCNFVRAELIGVTIDGNSADAWGGAIDNEFANTTLENSTVTNNTAVMGAGAIDNDNGNLTVINSTFVGNNSPLGGMLLNNGNAIIESSTIVGNGPDSAILSSDIANALISHSILDNGPALDCDGPGTITSQGYNIESATSCGFSLTTDQSNTDPLLAPLEDNGGLTQTMALLPNSPAIDTGSDSVSCPITDQRGIQRPQDGDGDGNAICDIGAFELEAEILSSLAIVDDYSGNLASEVALLRPPGDAKSTLR